MMLGLIGYQIKIKSSQFQWNPLGGKFLLRGAHLAMIELTSYCICVTERSGGDLHCERWRLPPLFHSSSPPIISKSSNTWQIRPPWGLLSFFLFKWGFLPHLRGKQGTSAHMFCNCLSFSWIKIETLEVMLVVQVLIVVNV